MASQEITEADSTKGRIPTRTKYTPERWELVTALLEAGWPVEDAARLSGTSVTFVLNCEGTSTFQEAYEKGHPVRAHRSPKPELEPLTGAPEGYDELVGAVRDLVSLVNHATQELRDTTARTNYLEKEVGYMKKALRTRRIMI